MLLHTVLTAVNEKNLYLSCVPPFIRAWKKLLPKIYVKVILISSKIPPFLKEYQDNIILFPPVSGVSTSFTAQFIRLLYPSLITTQDGVLITDVDMLPLNASYFVQNIQKYDKTIFLNYRNVLLKKHQFAMCYNIASPVIWKQIFGINNVKDIMMYLRKVHSKISYDNRHGGAGWATDQKTLYKEVMSWYKNGKGTLVILRDNHTKFHRLNRKAPCLRGRTSLTPVLKKKITSGFYSDYHMKRPYNSYRKINDEIISLI